MFRSGLDSLIVLGVGLGVLWCWSCLLARRRR